MKNFKSLWLLLVCLVSAVSVQAQVDVDLSGHDWYDASTQTITCTTTWQ